MTHNTSGNTTITSTTVGQSFKFLWLLEWHIKVLYTPPPPTLCQMRCVGLVQNICRLKITKGTHYLNLKLAQRQLYLVVSPADLAAINCEAVTGKICKTWPSPLYRANVKFCRFYLINHQTHPTLHVIVYSLWAGVIVLTQVLDGVSGEKGVSHGQLEIFSIFHFLSKLWYYLTPLASLNKIAECAGSTDTSTALVGQYCHHQHLSSQIQNQIKNRHNGYFDSHINGTCEEYSGCLCVSLLQAPTNFVLLSINITMMSWFW